MIMSRIFSSAEPGPQLTWTAMFINIFREAGWKVQNNQVERVTLGRPPAGIVLFRHTDGDPDPNDWRSGTWVRVSPGLAFQDLFPHRQLLNQVFAQLATASRLVADCNRSLRRNFNLRLDDVFLPVALRRRDVARQLEVVQGRKC